MTAAEVSQADRFVQIEFAHIGSCTVALNGAIVVDAGVLRANLA